MSSSTPILPKQKWPTSAMSDALTIAHDIDQARLRCEDVRARVANAARDMLSTDADDLRRYSLRERWEQALADLRHERAKHTQLVHELVALAENGKTA